MENNNNVPAISVVMSVYNGSKYLEKGINSILNQTFSDFELIVCDDGSSDNTYAILEEMQKSDERIVLLRNETNQGLAYSLDKAISVAKSNILARQDADDESALNRFEVQYPFVMEHPEYAIVGTSYYSVRNGENTLITPKYEPQAKDMAWDGGFMHPSWMMRKDQLEKVGFYTVSEYTRRNQDYHLVMKLYGEGMKMCNMPDALYYYSNDEDTFKRTRNRKRLVATLWIRWDAYRRNKFPFWMYFILLKPIVKWCMPNFIVKKYYYRKRK